MAYVQTGDGGRLRIEYTITPDIGQKIYVGDTVRINGTLRHDYFSNDVKSLGVRIGSTEVKYINTNIDRNVNAKFTIKFKMPVLSSSQPGNVGLSFTIYNKSGGINGGYSLRVRTTSAQSVYITNYSVKIEIDKFEITRASLRNGSYVLANEGTYGICTALHVNADLSVTSSDIDIIRLTGYSGGSQVLNKNISFDVIRTAMTSGGYVETRPNLLSDITLQAINDYRFVLEVGHSNETLISIESAVPRAFANMHLSGAKQGGVAFGGFSNSTDDDPKFECFFKGYFHKGFDEVTCKMIGNILYPVGSIYMNAQSSGNTNQAKEIFGGEWELIEGGRVLVGPGTISGKTVSVGDKGGSINHKHLAPIGYIKNVFGAIDFASGGNGTASGTAHGYKTTEASVGNSSDAVSDVTKIYTHNGGSFPPYLVVNIYKRTKLYDPVTGI